MTMLARAIDIVAAAHGRTLTEVPLTSGQQLLLARAIAAELERPMPIAITCPVCALPHIDDGEWTSRPHRTHLCIACGHRWQPAMIPTIGVPEDRIEEAA